MTAGEQKKMQELEAENAALKERLLVAQRTLAKYARMLFGQKTERCRLPEKPEELTGSLVTRKAIKLIVDSAVAVAPKAEEKTEG